MLTFLSSPLHVLSFNHTHLSQGLESVVLWVHHHRHKCFWYGKTCHSHKQPVGPAEPALGSGQAPDTMKRRGRGMRKVFWPIASPHLDQTHIKDNNTYRIYTHNRTIPSLQIGLVVDVYNSRKKVLQGANAHNTTKTHLTVMPQEMFCLLNTHDLDSLKFS